MYELIDSELDMVAGGAPAFIQAGDLIAVGIQVTDVLSHNQVSLHITTTSRSLPALPWPCCREQREWEF